MHYSDEQREKDIKFVDNLTVVLSILAGSYMFFYFIPMVVHKLFF
jgi:hypothetical protein